MASGWEENSKLVLTKLEDLAATDDKIVEQLTLCRTSIARLKTIYLTIGSILVVAVPIAFQVYASVGDGHRKEDERKFETMVARVKRFENALGKADDIIRSTAAELKQLQLTDTLSRENNWGRHGDIHEQLDDRIRRMDSFHRRMLSEGSQ